MSESGHPRDRKMTAKGLEYTIKVKSDRLTQLCKRLEHIMTRCTDLMDDDSPDVPETFRKWIGLYDQFLEVDEIYRSLLSIDKLNDYVDNWYRARQQVFEDFKNSAQQWICRKTESVQNIKGENTIDVPNVKGENTIDVPNVKGDNTIEAPNVKVENLIDEDHISELSLGSRATKTSVTAAKLVAAQRCAELSIKAATLKKKQALESAKLRLKQKEEELQLEEDVAISEAQADAIEELVSVHGSVRSVRIRKRRTFCDVDSDIESACQYHQREVNTCSITAHNNNLLSLVQHLNKPTSVIDKFDGDPLRYQHFMRQFRSRVVNNCNDSEERLNFLEQYTTGEAQQIVISFSYLDPQTGYDAALRELENRYGDQDVIVDQYIKKVLSWPTIRHDKPKDLDRFGVFLKECENAVQALNALQVLEYSDNMKKIVSKLPFWLHDKWRNIVFTRKERGSRPTFNCLVKFVTVEAKKAMDPLYGREALIEDKKISTQSQSSQRKTSLASNVSEAQPNKTDEEHVDNITEKLAANKISTDNRSTRNNDFRVKYDAFAKPCIHCKCTNHSLDSCYRLTDITHMNKLDILKTFGLCYGCLKPGHVRKLCHTKATCNVCKGRHPSVLHIYGFAQQFGQHHGPNNNQVISHTTGQIECHTGAGSADCTMAVLPVMVRSRDGIKTVKTYAFLDPGSNVSFCTDNIAQVLGISGPKLTVDMATMGMTHKLSTHRISGLVVSDIRGDECIDLPDVYTKDKLPVSKDHIPTASDISKWPHLKGIILPVIEAEIGLLIGNNVPDAYSPLEIKTGPKGTPHAARSRLGWILWNVVRDLSTDITVNSVHLHIQEAEQLRNLEHIYRQSVNMDFPENVIQDQKELSQEDHLFMDKVNASIIHQPDDHYEIGLPFRDDNIVLPDNIYQANQRLASLKKKLLKTPSLCADYIVFMESLISKGYAEQVPLSEVLRQDGKVWYLPHHGVYHPKKTGKIRVVFDCAAIYKGISLNSVLLQGPDLMKSLFAILLRFRQQPVSLMADIEAMFHQVRVPKTDQDCLRFLWWPDGNMKLQPEVYRMVVHLFGAISSPSCCNVAIQRTASTQVDYYPEASRALMTNFYVDDFLASVTSESEALSMINDVTDVCRRGGFHLTKWVSNSKSVLEQIPEEERAKSVKDLTLDNFPAERALGVCWDIRTDTLGFTVAVKDQPPTRRSILSLVSSVFDPLGMASPFVLTAKLLLQDLCRMNLSWDDKLTGPYLDIWENWLSSLPKLEELHMPRCLRPTEFGDISLTQLHYFADASSHGYGVVVYVRFSNTVGQIHCQLLISKARVAPIKKSTIPRMELTAATVAVKLHHKLLQELDIPIDMVFFWTDSMAVLRYIANERSRFQTFVANRISVIRAGSSIEQWKHVSSESNPADCVSRGLTVENLLKSEWWIKGPPFLSKPYSEWIGDHSKSSLQLPSDDPEVKQTVNVTKVEPLDDLPINRLLKTCSSWMKIK